MFQLDKKLLDKESSSLAVQITAGSMELLDAIRTDAVFPSGDIDLFQASLRAETAKDIVFETGGGKVSFSAGGGAFAGLGLLADARKRLEKLGFGQALENGLAIEPADGSRYLLLSWGYDVHGAAKGSVALGAAGGVTFGAEGSREAAYAMVRRVGAQAKARKTLSETFTNWRMPSQVSSHADLLPGSWVITEVSGSIALSLGAQLGYDFSWVRELGAGELKGEIGLKVALNAGVALGFEASGEYALVLHRGEAESANRVTLKLFKLNRKTLSFSATAGATVKSTADPPATADDLIAAVFGVHGAQILKDLETLEAWTDPEEPVGEMLSALGVDYGFDLLQQLTGVDARRELGKAQSKLQGALKRWQELPNELSASLWKQLDEVLGAKNATERKKIEAKIGQLRSFVNDVAQMDESALRGAITDQLRDVSFFATPVGQWLQTVAGDSVLSLLDRQAEVRSLAAKTAAVLDKASDTQGATEDVIRNIQKVMAERLHLDKIEVLAKKATQKDFDDIDQWLKLKLANFLDEGLAQLNLEKIRQVAATIHTLIGKRQEFYAAAVKALNRTYQFSFAYAYRRSTAKTALLDIELDFSENPQVVGALLQAAVRGDFSRVLTESVDGVRLNQARLTHEVRRQSSVEIALPHFDRKKVLVTQALATVDAVELDGRVLLYELKASDKVTVVGRRSSELIVAANLPVRAGSGITVWNPDKGFVGYRFEHMKKKLKREELEFELEPLVAGYFPDSFGTADDQQTLSEWIGALDRHIDQVEENGPDQFGNTVLGLELSYPIQTLHGWGLAPEEEDSREYRELYRSVQRSLRQVIPFYWFADPDHYSPLIAAAPLLVYQFLPISTQIKLAGSTLTLNSGDEVFWDYRDQSKLDAMAQSSTTRLGLERAVMAIQRRSRQRGLERVADDYKMATAAGLIGIALGDGRDNLESLLMVEADIARTAIKAGKKMAKFRADAAAKPEEALKELTAFGEKLTKAFNEKIRSRYDSVPLEPIGPMILVEASRAMQGQAQAAPPNALLDVTVYRQGAKFPPTDFPPVSADLVAQERLIAAGARG
ncbi:MAG: hypothetical protein GC160_29430 [Acidobacteria bacterium]|nr:hypothetical protein [Acidobacteriota bacterium]